MENVKKELERLTEAEVRKELEDDNYSKEVLIDIIVEYLDNCDKLKDEVRELEDDVRGLENEVCNLEEELNEYDR